MQILSNVILLDSYQNETSEGFSGTESDLYSSTVPENSLTADGERLDVFYAGIFGTGTASKILRVYFDGTLIFDSGSITQSLGAWQISATIVRAGSSTAKAVASLIRNDYAITQYAEVTGLDFTSSIILKITGESAAGGGKITSKFGYLKLA